MGVTEWEALDEIKGLNAPSQMLWSLIYRKLKGNRGNCMITLYESERLCQLIRQKNNRRLIDCDGLSLSFDSEQQCITSKSDAADIYSGRQEPINMVLPQNLWVDNR